MVTTAPELAALYDERTQTYAQFGNGAVAEAARALLPVGGRVLDIGCASGGLLALLRAQAAFTAGIELSEAAAAAAAEVADEVFHGDAEAAPFADASFDLVVLADVLEHVVVPERLLARAVAWTRPGGALVLSVPNIAHWRARLTIIRGRWPQEESGTFDASHLRFFTVDRLETLLAQAGLREVAVRPVVPRLRNHVRGLARVALAERVAEAGWQGLGRRRPAFFGYQLVGTARR